MLLGRQFQAAAGGGSWQGNQRGREVVLAGQMQRCVCKQAAWAAGGKGWLTANGEGGGTRALTHGASYVKISFLPCSLPAIFARSDETKL